MKHIKTPVSAVSHWIYDRHELPIAATSEARIDCVALAAEIEHDATLATWALDLGRTYLSLARDVYPDGSDRAVDGMSGATITGKGIQRFINADDIHPGFLISLLDRYTRHMRG